jgi:hypothetical protein
MQTSMMSCKLLASLGIARNVDAESEDAEGAFSMDVFVLKRFSGLPILSARRDILLRPSFSVERVPLLVLVLLLVVSAQEASKVSGSNDGIISSGSGDLLLLLVDLRGVALGSGDPSSGEYSGLSSSPSTTQDPSSCDFGIPEGIALRRILVG